MQEALDFNYKDLDDEEIETIIKENVIPNF